MHFYTLFYLWGHVSIGGSVCARSSHWTEHTYGSRIYVYTHTRLAGNKPRGGSGGRGNN